MPPRVSVLLPAYNGERYVREAVDSVLVQTFGDFEIVAVDDASTDLTSEVLHSISDPRLRVERNATNLGMTANWNRCLALARGEIVVKLDADDVFKPRALASIVHALDTTDAVAAGVRSLQCDESLEPFDGIQGDDAMQRHGIDPYRDSVHPGDRWYDFAALGYQLWSSCAFAVRRELLTQLGGWDARFGCASDTELIWRVLELGKPVAHSATVGVLYRVHAGSISDDYRKHGWLTWEAITGNLLSMSRVRARRPLRRALRMHYVRLWRRWHSSQRELPASICTNLDDVMTRVTPPPFVDVWMTRLRDGVSA